MKDIIEQYNNLKIDIDKLEYCFLSCEDNEVMYSVDMIRLNFILAKGEEFKNAFENYFNRVGNIDIELYETVKLYKYQFLHVIKSGDSTITVGLQFLSADSNDLRKGFIEFNPNKIDLESERYKSLIMLLKLNCEDIRLKLWDIAIDVYGVKREYVTVDKGNKHYRSEINSRDNKTEYIGGKQRCGRTKIYNKRIEYNAKNECENLINDVTRIELTCDGKWSSNEIKKKFPKIYLTQERQGETLLLNNSDRWLVELINSHQEKEMFIQTMPRRKKEKLSPYILGQEPFQVNTKIISNLREQILNQYHCNR